jgi:hypothetical protein
MTITFKVHECAKGGMTQYVGDFPTWESAKREFDPGHIESFVLVDSAENRSERMNVLEMRSFLQLLRFPEGEGTI